MSLYLLLSIYFFIVLFSFFYFLFTFQAFDILIVNKDFKAESADSVTLSRGDIVEVLKTSQDETKK